MEVRREVEIEGVDSAFRGYFEDEDKRVLVPGATPGDILDVAYVHHSRQHPVIFGEIRKVHLRGPHFQNPPCIHAAPVRGRCGGCPGMHLSDELRQEIQREAVEEELSSLGVSAVWEKSPEMLGYRNRSNFVVARKEGDLILGSYAPRSNDVVSMEDCLIVEPVIASLQKEILVLLSAQEDLSVGLEEEGLRWISLRGSGEKVVVELIAANLEAPYLGELASGIAALPAVVGVTVTRNDERSNSLRNEETKVLHGEGTLELQYGPLSLAIPAGAFAQLNQKVAAMIYDQAASWAESPQVVWDLYCGVGALGLRLLKTGNAQEESTQEEETSGKLLGLESVPSAVEGARKNAAAHNLAGAHFEVIDLQNRAKLKELQIPEAFQNPDVIALNPPRKGISSPLRERLTTDWMASKLIYMSCNPSSFARDAATLIEGGWKLEKVQAYDMLPMTTHVELLGLFTRPV